MSESKKWTMDTMKDHIAHWKEDSGPMLVFTFMDILIEKIEGLERTVKSNIKKLLEGSP